MKTSHHIIIGNSQNMKEIEDNKINLVVTSPPYPMIEMWDETFGKLNKDIKSALESDNGKEAYDLMHIELDKVWKELDRVVAPGGIIAINIGDATRKIGESFQLYSNHSKIINSFEEINYQTLPQILWRKQTNKPNKFMGSGMLPPNAYVTLEHEYILLFRKEGNRQFKNDEKNNRRESAYFWEERNNWFSDIWENVKGISQKLNDKKLRERNGAYPFELAYRLINMYSVKNDFVLDPFLGTGTTTIASVASGRNSLGYEIDPNFKDTILQNIIDSTKYSNEYIHKRISNHLQFVKNREAEKGELKHTSEQYDYNVVTGQEKKMVFNLIKQVIIKEDYIEAEYNKIDRMAKNEENNKKITNKKVKQEKLV